MKELNFMILNVYSILHFLIWLIIGRYVLKSWIAFFILSMGWEALELVLPFEFAIESWGNKITDIIVNISGFVVGQWWRDRTV